VKHRQGKSIHGGAFEFNRGRGTSAKQYFAGSRIRLQLRHSDR
jgi:hypothetical protein